MKITVLGTGNMGSAFTKQLSSAGHIVRVTGRDIDKAKALAAQFDNVNAYSAAEALGDSDVVVIATAYEDAAKALQSLGDLTGKVVIDITNPLSADYMSLTIGHVTSAGEEIAKAVPQAHVVKAFNTLFAQVLADGPTFSENQRGSVFVASDSERAKQTAIALAHSLGWKTVDAGGLINARYLEPLAGLNIYLGYGAGLGTAIAPVWLNK
ncbi:MULTISPECIES: NADPH-dependent F420 reductase [Gammaproteobacteria]|jgi:predicted dinucleotide-binding enzyme|uniref:NADPH-dependent F420 reductase n=1 Tax=Gammaproteobacteria TaxID=1236 RepID=UPI0019138D50|nr:MULTISPECIES: NADPH-dependent F420 reductase [Gammaproteobacteria]MBK5304510.1 NADPH-dependent F420 reductase [Bacillus sp. TH86]MBK5324279.1 NADPH-dependent F420 reductase [Bacillus sp. TH59]MBK5339229.1 NADPH-dependent F420 reductase [Bacillus sp. TH57]MBK5313277.1 NADPH-dependent F420 reductase [Pseudomonas sp. TH71]MBK5318776.1 NADPH-dependent F420 reductase [Erwinia sp. TH79]